MRIGIDAHSLEENKTGVSRYLFNLLRYWPKQDIVLYFKNKIPDDIPSGKVLNTNSNALFIHYFLPKAAKKDKVDILFCPGYIAPVFYKGDIALVLHDIIYEARPDLYNWPSVFDKILLKKVSKISAKKAKIIFTCSQFSKNEIIKYYKINPDKIFAIPLAADEKFKKFGRATSENKFIFYIGALIKRRFITEMIRAFKKLSDKLPNYKFLIVGKNYTNQQIKGNRIIHKNYVDEKDLPLLYNSADLFIWLSSYEGFGLPPLEAMACGTPVVTTKMGSLPETVGDAALFVKNPKNIDEIAQAIYKGLTDKNLREKLIKKGLEQARKFSWEKTAQETLKILLSYE
jgi:glycosyltransferase involved in cell wall biosynthesis